MANPHAPKKNMEDDAKGTPVWFAAFQAASLVASLFTDIASGRLTKALVPILKQWDWSMTPLRLAFDSELCFVILPKMVGVLWLTIAHVKNHFGALSLAVAVATTPLPIMLSGGSMTLLVLTLLSQALFYA